MRTTDLNIWGQDVILWLEVSFPRLHLSVEARAQGEASILIRQRDGMDAYIPLPNSQVKVRWVWKQGL